MAYRAICIALLLSSLLGAGCGTVANLLKPGPVEGGKTPFGGVRHDVACIKTAAHGECGCSTPPGSESEQYRQVARTLCCAADLPLSFIGDVVTWPYTASYSYINSPVPTPPVTQVPTPPVTQAAAVGPAQTPPSETLPAPRKLP